ncbi:MAG TPA: DNA repair protein RecO [Candidatus Babeliales bacterium]|nr:DNA repair protein RecO [Candidatus Babeliales bacterium]
MMRLKTNGIILARTNYGEADRIITFLTPDHGKVKVMAKAVRKSKSKLAGGIELFSISQLSFIIGRGEINTLVSTRMVKHFGNIVKNLDRTNTGYDLIKRLDRATESAAESAYFQLLEEAFSALDESTIALDLIQLWFNMQLLRLGGHSPNLRTDSRGQKLLQDKKYDFDLSSMSLSPKDDGNFKTEHIKFLRLGFSHNSAQTLSRINETDAIVRFVQPVIQSMLQTYIRI